MNIEMLGLTPEEQDMLTMNALLGSIDDNMAELEQARRNNAYAEVLEHITGKVTDTYTATRESFSDNLEYLYATFDAMASRVAEMGCSHDHFLESSLDAYNNRSDQSDQPWNTSHEHTHNQKSDTKTAKVKGKKGSKKKDEKAKKLSGWALLGVS